MDLFELALDIKTRGLSEAKAALSSVNAAGQQTAQTFQDTERQVGAGFRTYEKLEGQFRAGTISAEQLTKSAKILGGSFIVLAQSAIASVAGMEAAAAAEATVAVGAAAATTSLGLLEGALMVFGGGAALTALIGAGIGLITAAYHALADGSANATKETREFTDDLLKQKQAAFELSDAFRAAQEAGVLLLQMEAQGRINEIGERWFGNRKIFAQAQKDLAEANAKAAQLEVNALDRKDKAIKDALAGAIASWELEKSLAADRQRWADEAKKAVEDAIRLDRERSHAMDARIKLLAQALNFDDLRNKAQGQLASLEETLTAAVHRGNLSLERRLDLEQKLAAVQEARARKFPASATGPTIQNTPGGFVPSPSAGDMPNVGKGAVIPIDKGVVGEITRQFETIARHILKLVTDLATEIQQGLAQTLGDAIFNGFSAAFNGEGILASIKAFGKTVLAGLGDLMVQMGQTFIEYGVIMMLAKAGLFNPITAGPAAVAIGAALIALGSALGAIGKGSARGTASAGAFREPSGGTTEITRLKFVDRYGNPAGLTPNPAMVFNVFGPDDPKAQRAIVQAIANYERR